MAVSAGFDAQTIGKTTPPNPVAAWDADAHELDDPKAKDNVAGEVDISCTAAIHSQAHSRLCSSSVGQVWPVALWLLSTCLLLQLLLFILCSADMHSLLQWWGRITALAAAMGLLLVESSK